MGPDGAAAHVLGRLPVRVGRIVVFHPPFIVGRILLPLMINFIIPKLKKRMSVINGGKIVAIHEFIHKEALFAEYDGTLRPVVRRPSKR